MKNSNFHKILSSSFDKRNLSELARELDMPRSILQDWIQEKRMPSMKNLKYIAKIAEYLNLTLDELLIGQVEEKTITSISFEDNDRKYHIVVNRIK